MAKVDARICSSLFGLHFFDNFGFSLVVCNDFYFGAARLVESVAAIFLNAFVGDWLGRHNRLYATQTILAVNNLSIVFSCLSLVVCMFLGGQQKLVYTACLVGSVIASALSRCASEGEKLVFTKDWIVVLSKREVGSTLSNRNATITVIGHLASLVTALVAAYLIVYFGYLKATLIFVGFNLVSWAVECYLLTKLYNEVTELHNRHDSKNNLKEINQNEKLINSTNESTNQKSNSNRLTYMIKTYWKQPTLSAALCLVLAFMTVLGFDGIPISYGKANGLPDDLLGIFKSIASLISIIGALLYTFLERRVGVRLTGLIGVIASQVSEVYYDCIHQILNVTCVLSIYLPGSIFDLSGYISDFNFDTWSAHFVETFSVHSPTNQLNGSFVNEAPREFLSGVDWSTFTINGHPMTSILVFFTGITLARLGVWLMDLSVMQIMQESIAETERMTVFGVENSLCQILAVCKDLLVIMFPDKRIFGLLIWMSVCFVFAGFLNYVWYFFKGRSNNVNKQRE
ncbi:Solute carrier family 40 protein [Aphelenchoides bicaudatus]|nr:Solute carrier family 40 protein [Aphelenchoides bicaudatus]